MKRAKNQVYQMEVMGVVGYAIMWCQRVERTIAQCVLISAKLGTDDAGCEYFDIWNPQELARSNRKKPLGRLATTVGLENWFVSSFRRRFTRFVVKRNDLVHRCFDRCTTMNNLADLRHVHILASTVIREADYFQTVFDAFFGMQVELQIDSVPVKQRKTVMRLLDKQQQRGDFAKLISALKKNPLGRTPAGGTRRGN
jgi:hypothetical protein